MTSVGTLAEVTGTGRKDSVDDVAYTLIRALTDFVMPIIQGQTEGRDFLTDIPESVTDTLHFRHKVAISTAHAQPGSILTEEAGQLLSAVKTFVASLCLPSIDQEDAAEEPVKHEGSRSSHVGYQAINIVEEETEPTVANNVNIQSEGEEIPGDEVQVARRCLATLAAEDQEILDSLLEEAHHVVFNKMPIRMLIFNEDGTGIRLVERPEIYRHITSQLERTFQLNRYLDCFTAQYLIPRIVKEHTRYAILSHTWFQGGEVTYADWNKKAYDQSSSPYTKLTNFCRIAATEHGTTLGWMDTICINKDSSSELDESIRSMYKWYERAHVCIAYLADTAVLSNMHADRWFTRGWTLQELVAPESIHFYARDWTQLGIAGDRSDKENETILQQIQTATSITSAELNWHSHTFISISRRMQWAAARNVTREEDMAYALMGIFDVSIATAYGEGAERAFLRLVREILSVSDLKVDILDITNWAMGPSLSWSPKSTSFLIPASPREYAYRWMGAIKWYSSDTPIMLTRVGLHVPVLLMPVLHIAESETDFEGSFTPQGSFYASIQPRLISEATPGTENSFTYTVLNSGAFDQSAMRRNPGKVITKAMPRCLVVLNFLQRREAVCIPAVTSPCFAIMMRFFSDKDENSLEHLTVLAKEETELPITFNLECQETQPDDYIVPQDQLYKHGIVLRTMYL